MEKTVETRLIDNLKPHPRNAVLYGNEHEQFDEKLVASLKGGIWPGEIQVTTSNIIISGHRRCDHAIFAGIEEAKVWVRTDLPEDPNTPEVLEALLQGNLQRNKTTEQKLQEFGMWLEVEKPLAKARIEAAKTQNGLGRIYQGQKPRTSRDLAAQRTGFTNGSTAEKALKALKAADEAELSGDEQQVTKARLVKQELAKSLGGAVRVAREQGLIAGPKPRAKAKPTVEPLPSAVEASPQPAEPEQEPDSEPEPQLAPESAAFALTPPEAKPSPISPEERKRHYSQIKWVTTRWVPAAKALIEARRLLKDENTRLGDAYRHRENGGKMFTIPYQRLAKEWEEKGHLTEIAEALGSESQSLDAVLLKLEEVAKELEGAAKSCATMASGMRMFTGCRPDNNLHE